MGDVTDDSGIRAVGDNEPKPRHAKREGHGVLEIVPDDGPVEGGGLWAWRAGPVPTEPAEKIQGHYRQENHPEKNHGKHAEQDNRIAVIPPNLCLEPDVFHTGRTFGALRRGHGHPIAMLQGSL